MEVYLVLEEDGTEVDDEEYFQVDHDDEVNDEVDDDDEVFRSKEMSNQQKAAISEVTRKQSEQIRQLFDIQFHPIIQTLPVNTRLMLLLKENLWSPDGPAYTYGGHDDDDDYDRNDDDD